MANPQASPIQRVLVSYSAATAILGSSKWTQVQSALAALLPLRNIHWKSPTKAAIRTIQELDVGLVSLDGVREEYSQVPVTVLDKPLLNIYVVVVNNTDVDGYRTNVKKQIKDWQSLVTSRKNQEWLILHIIRPDTRAPTANFFQLKGSVFEKIRADFNIDKKERCVQVSWSPETDAPAVWAELINKIKDGVLSAFDAAVTQREEEVKRSESQRQMPGWNFCTFFILKESLASSYEGVNLFEDAYTQYDELETTFHHVLKEKNLSWFGTLIHPVSGDDSASLLYSAKKPYRELILANSISIFDLRIYLLARQCELLAQRGRVSEVCRKSATFLSAFGRRLRDVESTLPPFFIESWIYSSALSVVEYCDNWASSFQISGTKSNSFSAIKGELLELARSQLDIVGVTVGHLPEHPPFSSSFRAKFDPKACTLTNQGISNVELRKAIEDAEVFWNLYVATTNRAIDMYTKAGRKKFALRLHGSLAALDLHRGHHENALSMYTSLPAHYAPHMWTSLESFMLSKALDTHTEYQQERDTEWIHVLLSFLKSYIDNQGSELLIHEENKVEYITELVDSLRKAAHKLEADLAHPDHPVVSLKVSPNARLAETKDGCFVDLTIQNHLPCEFYLDELSVILTGRETEQCRFSIFSTSLPPGKSKQTLFCSAAAAGTYVVDSSELRVARLCFQWAHRTPPKSLTIRKEMVMLVRIPKDLLALDVQLSQPNQIELGQPSTLLVTVSSGRNHVLKASVKLASSGVTFRPQDAYFSGAKNFDPPEVADKAIVLHDVPEDTLVPFMVPHSDTSAFQAMKVLLEVEYVTTSEPTVLRKMRTTQVVLTALPISVNVEDFFRGSRLFSKFTISTTSHQHVRISTAQLMAQEGGFDGVKIIPCATKNRGVLTVTPSQSVNFLFCVNSEYGPVREPLYLSIRYRMLREEVESVVEEAVLQVLAETPSMRQHRVVMVNKLVEALEVDAAWVDLYGITGELKVPDKSRRDEEDGEMCALLDKAKQLLKRRKHPSPPEGQWREIKIPVDVPYMSIVAAARFRILSTPFSTNGSSEPDNLPLYAGQPISVQLTVQTSFHWGESAGNKEQQYMLRYDVEEVVQDWLVSGPKRGDFAAFDGATHTVMITMIALHHGELSLPSVAITALPLSAGAMTMGSMAVPSIETYQIHGAEKVLVLPRGGRSTFVVGMGPESN